jgi:two-component system cell cycle response regulator
MDNSEKEKLLDKISELEEKIKNLENDLVHDSLTALKKREFFLEELGLYLYLMSEVVDNRRKEWFGFKKLSVLFFDIDHFKKINDTYGHATGDIVLRVVAQTIVKNLRPSDQVARFGGEEMVAVLLGAELSDAKKRAEVIRQKVDDLTFDSAPDLKVTVSIGVAESIPDITPEAIIKKADEAVYKAKESGRNQVVAFKNS